MNERKITFVNKYVFNEYMKTFKPKKLFLDKFSTEEPYIILSLNDGVKFRGKYNHQLFLSGDNGDFTWLYEEGLYAKENINVNCCNDCKHFEYVSPSTHNPYPEFMCWKNHWDGIEAVDDLLKPIKCIDFEKRT